MDNSFTEYLSFREECIKHIDREIKKLNIDKEGNNITEKRYEYLMNILITRKDEIQDEIYRMNCKILFNTEPLLVSPKKTVSSLELIKNQSMMSDHLEECLDKIGL